MQGCKLGNLNGPIGTSSPWIVCDEVEYPCSQPFAEE